MRVMFFGRNPQTAQTESMLTIERIGSQLQGKIEPRANPEMLADFLSQVDNSTEETCAESMKALEQKYSGGYFWARFEPDEAIE